jgi:uncharacterized protein
LTLVTIIAIILAFVCWAFTFGIPQGNFWVKIGLSVIIVTAYSLWWHRPVIRPNWRSFVLGAISAVVLYFIFYAGNIVSALIFSNAGRQVGGIYGLGHGTNHLLIFLLLLLVTGPGEEIFWRGFLQSRIMKRFGDVPGYIITTCVYAGVHVFSGNIILIGAALIAGAFWGAMYMWRKDLFMQIVSHSLWSSFIFAVTPIDPS